ALARSRPHQATKCGSRSPKTPAPWQPHQALDLQPTRFTRRRTASGQTAQGPTRPSPHHRADCEEVRTDAVVVPSLVPLPSTLTLATSAVRASPRYACLRQPVRSAQRTILQGLAWTISSRPANCRGQTTKALMENPHSPTMLLWGVMWT